MTAVIDYQYSVPSAYQFPARKPVGPVFSHPSSSISTPVMVKHHPQPLNLQTPMSRPSPYLQPSVVSRQPGSPAHIQTNSHMRSNSTSTAVSGGSLHRSTSNASSGSGNAYVTRLRKQKATVWCDRAQREDARLLAAQKAAKAKAAKEIAKAAAQAGANYGGLGPSPVHRGKIRHHGNGGKHRSIDHEFSTNRSLVAGVPARLDIEDDSSDEDHHSSANGSVYGGITRRTNSGRSSINSARRYQGTPQLQLQVHVQHPGMGPHSTHTSSPSSYSRSSSLMETAVPEVPEIVETPGTIVPDVRSPTRQEYFPGHNKSSSRTSNNLQPIATGTSLAEQHNSFGSSSSGESRPGVPRSHSSREPGDLRRKGSIDESRTMTMGRVRLFVANPDQ